MYLGAEANVDMEDVSTNAVSSESFVLRVNEQSSVRQQPGRKKKKEMKLVRFKLGERTRKKARKRTRTEFS